MFNATFLKQLQEPALNVVKRAQNIQEGVRETPTLLWTDFGPYTEGMLKGLGVDLKNGLENLTQGEEFIVLKVVEEAYRKGVIVNADGTIDQIDVPSIQDDSSKGNI